MARADATVDGRAGRGSAAALVLREAARRAGSSLRLVRFSHTLFAMPWALAGLFLGSGGLPGARVLGLVLCAMVGARTAAMAFNRLVDRRFDRTNARTAGRPSVTGEVSPRAMGVLTAGGAALFLGAAASLNPLTGVLAPPTLLVLLAYSFTKRFTALCHLALGVALGIAPLGGYLAARGAFDEGSLAAALLGAAVVLWTAGFDVIYAIQDVEHDRREGLRSIPARCGAAGGLRAARVLHALVPVALALAGRAAGLGPLYWIALGVVALLLVLEHVLARGLDPARLGVAFFPVNVAIAFVVMAAVLADLLLAGRAP